MILIVKHLKKKIQLDQLRYLSSGNDFKIGLFSKNHRL